MPESRSFPPGVISGWSTGRRLIVTTAAWLALMLFSGRILPAQDQDGSRASSPGVRLTHAPGQPPAIEVTGLSSRVREALQEAKDWDVEQWQRLLSVFVETDSTAEAPPVLGRYSLNADTIRFVPRFPLSPSVKYRVVLRPEHLPGAASSSPGTIMTIVSPPAPTLGPLAEVTHVFPSSEALPENQLKFYLHFSAPMSQGNSYRYIHLLKENGEEVAWPFLELGEELWEETGTRLTVFIDPGRIKRGLIPREEMGPVLEAGQQYVLAIDGDWPDAHGRPLKSGFRKRFQATQADETQPQPASWKMTVPSPGSRSPLTIDFGEALDEAMLQRVLTIYAADDEPVPGKIEVSDEETRWSFVPTAPWQAGHFELRVHHTLEDLAGNSIGRPFEVDLQERIEHRVETPRTVLPFSIGQ